MMTLLRIGNPVKTDNKLGILRIKTIKNKTFNI